jgi:hypothetical protein
MSLILIIGTASVGIFRARGEIGAAADSKSV